ncbi:hypothetical protein MACH10_26230 [Thalassospira tepidiphila]|nr:hypothetical protein MACH10_26230 [Thalassospira tepidiphila]
MIGMAEFRFVKSKENAAKRVGIPLKGFDAGVRKYKLCPSDRSDLHGLHCRNTLKDKNLPAVLLRVSAQI